LEQAREHLFQAQKMESVGQLTRGVAHDFNNLLTAVGGSLSLVRHLITDQRALRLLDTAESAVARGSRLTQQLLAFSRQQPVNPEKANANELVASLASLLRHAAGQNVEIRLDLSPLIWLCEIDRTQLQSALLNLVVNARDAIAGPGGVITIQTRNCEIDEKRAASRTRSTIWVRSEPSLRICASIRWSDRNRHRSWARHNDKAFSARLGARSGRCRPKGWDGARHRG